MLKKWNVKAEICRRPIRRLISRDPYAIKSRKTTLRLMEHVPSVIVVEIFSYLNWQSFTGSQDVSTVCRAFRSLVKKVPRFVRLDEPFSPRIVARIVTPIANQIKCLDLSFIEVNVLHLLSIHLPPLAALKILRCEAIYLDAMPYSLDRVERIDFSLTNGYDGLSMHKIELAEWVYKRGWMLNGMETGQCMHCKTNGFVLITCDAGSHKCLYGGHKTGICVRCSSRLMARDCGSYNGHTVLYHESCWQWLGSRCTHCREHVCKECHPYTTCLECSCISCTHCWVEGWCRDCWLAHLNFIDGPQVCWGCLREYLRYRKCLGWWRPFYSCCREWWIEVYRFHREDDERALDDQTTDEIRQEEEWFQDKQKQKKKNPRKHKGRRKK